MNAKPNTTHHDLVQFWVPVADAAGRIHMESRWLTGSRPAASTTHVVHAA